MLLLFTKQINKVKIMVLFALSFFAISVKSQQIPQYSHFLFNSFAINPATAGLKKCLDMRFGYRTQWVGFEGNPKTGFANINGSLKSKKKQSLTVKHGFGASIVTDDTGPTGRTMVSGAYAIHLPITRKSTLSFGTYIGVIQHRLDVTKTRTQFADPAISNSSTSFIFPDISPGFWLYTKKGFLGGTLTHALANDISGFGNNSNLQRHYNFTVGRIWGDVDYFSFIPAAQLKLVANSRPALDINLIADYQQTFAVGLLYRSSDAVAGLLKINFLQYFTLAYAYDFTTSKIRVGSSNTHEIILGISACPKNAKKGMVPCGAYN
jgi:type IX secretion system PorP/SprF family membrane protein